MSRAPSTAFLPLLPLPRGGTRQPIQRRTSTQTRFCHDRPKFVAGLSTPNGLPNLRDLASAAPKVVRANRIYRGSTPAALPPTPSAESVAFLRSTPVLLDLRSKDERVTDNVSGVISACGPDFWEREVHIGLLNKRRVVYGLARALPTDQVKQLAWRAVSQPFLARKVIVGRVDEGGLVLLNRILVDVGARSIGRAMNVIVDAVVGGEEEEEGRGRRCYFYCSAGKDRTGLLAALILEILGVDRKDIVRDYVRSSETWQNGPYELREDYCARLEHVGLTPVKWLGAPPEVMDETLRLIDNKYGSVEDYLIHCGLSEEKMNQLQKAMTAL